MGHNAIMIDTLYATPAEHLRREAASPALYVDPFESESRMVRPEIRTEVGPVELVSILLVSPYAADHLLIPRILAGSNWQCRHCHNWHHAAEILGRSRIGVVLCERDQTNGSWRDMLETAQWQSRPPSVIVCSRRVDEVLWAEVLNLGGYDVLIKPFDHEEVLRVVSGAWRSWKEAPSARSARNVAVEESTFDGLRGTGSSQDSSDNFR
jgi:DNA-binding response OmpR family regulator